MNLEDLNPLERFSRVTDDYTKYRPGYPEGIVGVLTNEYALSVSSVIADIGSGTGKLSKLFLDNGNTLYAVEPNLQMRQSAESIFGENSKFISINGSAENSMLQNNLADFVVCGQAFHWFHVDKALIEFERILKKNGIVALIWNKRDDSRKMMAEYKKLIKKYCPERKKIGNPNFTKKDMDRIFKPHPVKYYTFGYYQILDFEELAGRLRSSSYSPPVESVLYNQLMLKLKVLFDEYQQDGKIRFNYKTEMFVSIF